MNTFKKAVPEFFDFFCYYKIRYTEHLNIDNSFEMIIENAENTAKVVNREPLHSNNIKSVEKAVNNCLVSFFFSKKKVIT